MSRRRPRAKRRAGPAASLVVVFLLHTFMVSIIMFPFFGLIRFARCQPSVAEVRGRGKGNPCLSDGYGSC